MTIDSIDVKKVEQICESFLEAWKNRSNVFFCGNGGSAGNASHLVNDYIFGIGRSEFPGIRCESLSANPSTITCLANDVSYEEIFALQLKTLAQKGDILVALSGSGNSKNIIRAIETANNLGMKTFAILGFDGGECKKIAHHPIHFEINDMQISEDMQLIVGHIIAQYLMKEIPLVGHS